MTTKIDISRAAREMGLARKDLRQRLRNAGVPMFEGKVDLEQLRQVAPQWDLLQSTAVAEAKRIQDAATAVRDRKALGGGDRDPEAELRKVSKKLLLAQGQVKHLDQICQDLIDRLGELQSSSDPACRDLALELSGWLVARLKSW